MKKLIILLVSLLSLGVLSSCGGKQGSDNKDSISTESHNSIEKHTLSLYDESSIIKTITSTVGEKIDEPDAIEKENFFFKGWFLDKALSIPASFPITMGHSNIFIYAKYIDAKTAFLEARDKTVGLETKGFEYNYNVHLEAKYGNLTQSLNGNQIGVAQYNNSNDEKISYYDHHENTGSLFYDGFLYQTKTSSKLQKIRLNEDKKITSIKDESVDKNYRYGSSTFAKPLFEYDESQIKSISKQADSRYLIKTSANASKIISIILNNIDNPILGKLIGVSIPETDTLFETYVTFDNDYLKDYEYVFKINISNVQLSLTYKLSFTNKNQNIEIIPEKFDGVHFKGTTEFNNDLSKVTNAFVQYTNKQYSSHHVVLKTGVDYGFKTNAINSTFNVTTKQSKKDSKLDYVNKVEVDSDFKNADLYDKQIADLTYYRGTLQNGEVWDAKWSLIGTSNEQKVENPRNNDQFYLLPNNSNIADLFNNNSYSCVTKEEKNGKTYYTFGLEENTAKKIMKYINDTALLTPYITSGVKVLGDYDENSIVLQNLSFEIVLDESSNLINLSYFIDGIFKTKFIGSRDFETLSESDFDLKLDLEIKEIDSYVVPAKAKDLKF